MTRPRQPRDSPIETSACREMETTLIHFSPATVGTVGTAGVRPPGAKEGKEEWEDTRVP